MNIFSTITAPAANENFAPVCAVEIEEIARVTEAFEAGKTYWTRSVCDSDCIVSITVDKRTAKTITTTEGKRLRIFTDCDGNEAVRPWGNFSMCPIIDSSKVAQ